MLGGSIKAYSVVFAKNRKALLKEAVTELSTSGKTLAGSKTSKHGSQ